jgi:acetyltransferase-like isoleucine patch superfamily enzyme
MTGRDQFSRLKPVLNVCHAIARVIPTGLFKASWFLVSSFPGKIGIGFRYIFAKRLAKSCGDNVMIGPNCTILNWSNLSIGSNVTLHVGGYIDALGGIYIGDNVSIAHACSLVAFEHGWADANTPIKYNPLIEKPIHIADDVWIGCGVRILAGAEIATRSIIAAGAVVIGRTYESGIHAGVPAKLRKTLS